MREKIFMQKTGDMRKVAFLGDYLPRKCDIATFTTDLCTAVAQEFKDEFGVAGKQVLLTFGLLSPNKGIEFALRALPRIIKEFPNIVFIVVGQTHPNLMRYEGELYRLSLERLAKDSGTLAYAFGAGNAVLSVLF